MKSKQKIINIVFALVLLIVAGVWFWANSHRQTGGVARLTYGDDSTVMDIPLNEDKEYDIDTGYYTIHLQVKDGKIAFVNSPCPDHKCEGFGWLSKEDDWAACLPAKANVTILKAE